MLPELYLVGLLYIIISVYLCAFVGIFIVRFLLYKDVPRGLFCYPHTTISICNLNS